MRVGVIYKIINRLNGKMYVGKHAKPAEHFFKSKYYGSGLYIRNAINKYGNAAFDRAVIEETRVDCLNERERFWIRELNTVHPSGYNIHTGGDGPIALGRDTKKKISDSLKGHVPWNKGLPASEEQKRKQSIAMIGKRAGMTGKQHSVKTKKLIRSKTLGYTHTNVAKLKMSIAVKSALDVKRADGTICDGPRKSASTRVKLGIDSIAMKARWALIDKDERSRMMKARARKAWITRRGKMEKRNEH